MKLINSFITNLIFRRITFFILFAFITSTCSQRYNSRNHNYYKPLYTGPDSGRQRDIHSYSSYSQESQQQQVRPLFDWKNIKEKAKESVQTNQIITRNTTHTYWHNGTDTRNNTSIRWSNWFNNTHTPTYRQYNMNITYGSRPYAPGGDLQSTIYKSNRTYTWYKNYSRPYDADLDGTTLPSVDFVYPPNVIYKYTEIDGNFPWFNGKTSCIGNSCTPPTGNLLIGRERNLTASSTCGLHRAQIYCVVADYSLHDRCDQCITNETYRRDVMKYHSIVNVVKEDKFWWQAENGVQNVSIRFDLDGEFHLSYIVMTFQTFRPAAMLIERSYDFGQTWKVYQYFAFDCAESFPGVKIGSRTQVDDVVCESEYSHVEPFFNGEVIFKVLPPNIKIDDPYSARIQDLLKLTNLRINFTKLHTLGAPSMSDKMEFEKFYYAIRNMKIHGSCSCYGHANRCVPMPGQIRVFDMIYAKCECDHNTNGTNCEKCNDMYWDVPWKPALGRQTNECKKCNCNNHATSCRFDEAVYIASNNRSGGVCIDCQHHTTGRQCDKCQPLFYKDPTKRIDDPYICKACDCDKRGSLYFGECDAETDVSEGTVAGRCHCKENVQGSRCDQCKPGFYNFSEFNPQGCQPCNCNKNGTIDRGCDPNDGTCFCKRNVIGKYCDQCLENHIGPMPDSVEGCEFCECDIGGSISTKCGSDGKCICRKGIKGIRCTEVESGYFIKNLDYETYEAGTPSFNSPNSTMIIEHYDEYPDVHLIPWSGDGFLRINAKSNLESIIDSVPYAMKYKLIIRYRTISPDWSISKIQVTPTFYGANCFVSINKKLNFPKDSKYIVIDGPFCFDKEQKYKITFDIEPGYHAISHIDIDSITVFPYALELPIFSDSSGEEKKHKFNEFGCEIFYYEKQNSRNIFQNPTLFENCKKYFFTISSYINDGAKECKCNLVGSRSQQCEPMGGQCECANFVVGRTCDKCAPGYYNFSSNGCQRCKCKLGSPSHVCDPITGKCKCKHEGIHGDECDKCLDGFWKFPECIHCSCNDLSNTCDQDTGLCFNCKGNTVGTHCEFCAKGYFNWTTEGCQSCECDQSGSTQNCDQQGKCECIAGFGGDKCNECESNYWGDPRHQCLPCNCLLKGAQSTQCNKTTGDCFCKEGFAGKLCDECKKGWIGTAPKCHPCGECFDNWDRIISNLREETKQLTQNAEAIKKEGAPGAYTSTFYTIENRILDIESSLAKANISDANIAEVERLIDNLRMTLTELQNKLDNYDDEMNRTLDRTAQSQFNINMLKTRMEDIQTDTKYLKENATLLQAANVEGAINLTMDAKRRSDYADSKVNNEMQKLLESAQLRRKTETLISINSQTYSKTLDDNSKLIDELEKQVSELENSIPDINKLVCGEKTAINDCSSICGGAGCDKCGDFSCKEAAKSAAASALDFGSNANEKIKQLRYKAEDELKKLARTNTQSELALKTTKNAYDKALYAKNISEKTSRDLQELLNKIDNFMSSDTATPAEIRTIAEECLATNISLSPNEIMDLSKQINDTMKSITDVEKIIVETSGNVTSAILLKTLADDAKTKADRILEMAQTILKALEEAKRAHESAEMSIRRANEHVSNAEKDLSDIENEAHNLNSSSSMAQENIDSLQKRLETLKKKFNENHYEIDMASRAAGEAGALAKEADRRSSELSVRFEHVLLDLDKKESLSGQMKNKSEELRKKIEKLVKDVGDKFGILQKIEDEFDENQDKLKEYSNEIFELNERALKYLGIIEEKSRFHKTCTS